MTARAIILVVFCAVVIILYAAVMRVLRMSRKTLVPAERIERSILLIRGQRVMLDADLAGIYQVPTKRLNEQVKRNRRRFPDDFVFQLTGEERAEVVANCDHLRSLLVAAPLKPPPQASLRTFYASRER